MWVIGRKSVQYLDNLLYCSNLCYCYFGHYSEIVKQIKMYVHPTTQSITKTGGYHHLNNQNYIISDLELVYFWFLPSHTTCHYFLSN